MRTSVHLLLGFMGFVIGHGSLWAQDAEVDTSPLEVDDTVHEKEAVLDNDPFSTSRNSSMGQALDPFADSVDAAVANPAGIGGIHHGNSKVKSIRQYHFPYVSYAHNEDNEKFTEDFGLSGGLSGDTLKTAIDDTSADGAGDLYSRGSAFINVGISRFIVGPIYDTQLAVVKPYEDADYVNVKYRQKSGAGAGMSFTDPKGRLYLGIFGHHLSVEELVGNYNADHVADLDTADATIDENKSKYTGFGMNVGMLWRINSKAVPVISVTGTDLANTKYSNVSGPGESYEVKEDMAVAFGVSPQIAKYMYMHFGVRASQLTENENPLSEKWHTTLGFNIGSNRSVHSFMGVNGGFNDAGASFGGHMNIGMIGLQYANYPVNIGANDEREIERRTSGVISINLAD